MKATTVPERLAANRFEIDEDESHIVIDQELCRTTGTGKAIIAVCPAGVYSEREDGTIAADYAACLECGTCRIVAGGGIVSNWEYPQPTMGVEYRYG